MKQLLIAVKATIVLTLLTGLAYPLLVTGLSQVLFRDRADGSLIVAGGKNIGSEIIGQHFTKPEYFHGRPDGFDGLSSGGSNFGPTNQKLIDRVRDDAKKFRAENPTFTGAIPADILTSSGSGLDPDISPEAADAQVDRVAGARGATAETIRRLVAANTDGRQFGIWGEPRVNVLRLNLALDRLRTQ